MKCTLDATVSSAAIVTKSIDGPDCVADEGAVGGEVGFDAVDEAAGTDGRATIIAVGTGLVFKSRSASVIRARILSMPSERAVAFIAALFAGVSSVIGEGVGFGNMLVGCADVGC